MSAPYSRIRELDQTARVVGLSTVSMGILIPNAERGDTTKPVLVSSQSDLLRNYTLNNTAPVGSDNAYFSALAFLEQGNSLFVRRVAGIGELMAGNNVNSAAAPVAGTVTSATLNTITLAAALPIGASVVMTSGTQLNTAVTVTSIIGLVATISPAFTVAPLAADTYNSFTSGVPLAVGIATANANVFGATTPLFLSANSTGAWGNSVYVKISPYFALGAVASPNPLKNDPLNVGELNSFRIEVFLAADLVTPVETFTCSRDIAHKNGYNVGSYVNDVLQGSMYIRGANNPVLANTIMPAYTPTPMPLAGGVTGAAVTDGEMIIALQDFTNVISYPMTAIMDGGRATQAYQAALIILCEQRNDCVTLLSVPYATETLGAQAVVDYRQVTLNANTSFAAMYSSWVRIYDRSNSRYVYVSPEGYIASLIASNALTSEVWTPPAGEVNGIMNVAGVYKQWTEAEMSLLYDANVNPILITQGSGIMAWGQKTLQSRASDTDRLNVRLALAIMEPATKKYLRQFVFAINDAPTRRLAKFGIEQFLAGMRARGAFFDYKVVIDLSNNLPNDIAAHKLNVDVYIKASISVEFVTTTVVLTPRATSFAA